MKITNFGGNVRFTPKHSYTPTSENEVLEILNNQAKGNIRVISSLHSWSDVTVSNDTIIDLRHFKTVEIIEETKHARIGAGCTLSELLDYVHEHSSFTLPTLSGITKQTIAGATATGTHGTGKSSLSHYIDEVRVAAYDPATKKAKIYTINEGEELLAARCSLGCMGVVLSVTLRLVPKYWMEECTKQYEDVREVLAQRKQYSLQQFTLFPYLWRYYAYHRTIVAEQKKEPFKTKLHTLYDYIKVELGLHAMLKLVQSLGTRAIFLWWQKIIPHLISPARVVGESETILTLHTKHHYTFKHVEMEVFVPEKNVPHAVEIIQALTHVFAGKTPDVPTPIKEQLQKIGLYDELHTLQGSYVHHYPFFFRYIHPDDTLISMTSGNTPYYSISIFTFLSPKKQEHYYQFCRYVARALTKLCGARLHWGKYFPLTYEEVKDWYPKLETFKNICKNYDPEGRFRNTYTKRVLGLN